MKNVLLILMLFCLFIIKAFSVFNEYNLRISKGDSVLIQNSFKNAIIKDSLDIIELQNEIVDKIHHKYIGINELSLRKIISTRSGLCYDRSFLLQKVFIMNGFKVRPIFIYFNTNGDTKWYDIFSQNLESHNVFEIKFKDNWWLIRTNSKMQGLETIDHYLIKTFKFKHAKYIRYLNNRNGRFIAPFWIPDIYGI